MRKIKKNNFLKVKNLTNKSADLYIYGEIVDNTGWKWDESDVMPNDVREVLEGLEGLDTLNIYINSPGGSVFSGLAIYNMLKRNNAKKIVHIDGVAASIASVIALAGDEVLMPSNAFMMIHKPWTMAFGNANDFRKVADDLDVIEKGLLGVYEDNIVDGVDFEEVKEMVNNETWLDANEATKYFNIKVIDAVEVAASGKDILKNYNNVPKELVEENTKSKQEDKTELELIKLQNELDLLEVN